MPAYDKLTDGRILPTKLRQAQGALIASNWRNCTCVRWDAGAIPTVSSSCVINRLIAIAYVYFGRG